MNRTALRSLLVTLILIVITCALGGWLESLLRLSTEPYRLISFTTGIGVGTLLFFGTRYWSVVFVGALLGQVIAGEPWPWLCFIPIGVLGSSLLAVRLWNAVEANTLSRPTPAVRFILLVVFLSPMCSAFFRMLTWWLTTSSMESLFQVWLGFWVSDLLGVLIIVPPLLCAFREPWTTLFRSYIPGSVLWTFVTLLTFSWLFWNASPKHLPLAFVSIPLMVWGVLRFGLSLPSCTFLPLALISSLATAHCRGPYGGLSALEAVTFHGLFLFVLTGTGVTLSAMMADQRRMENELRESRGLFQAISEQMPDALYLVDADEQLGTILHANKAAAKMRGSSMTGLIGLSVLELVESDRKQKVQGRLDNLLEGKTVRTESLHRREDGSKLYVDLSSRLILYGGRRVILLLMRDITERRKAEDALRQSQAQMAEAQRLAGFGNWEWYPATNRVIYSPHMLEMMGFDPTTFPGTLEAVLAKVVPEDLPILQKAIERTLTNGEVTNHLEYRVRPNEHSEITLQTLGLHIERDEEGNIFRIVGASLDVTERKQQEEEKRLLESRVLQGQKMESLGVLAGGVAHDFNNLLTIIIGNASLALMEMLPDSSGLKYIQRIEEAAHRAADLCAQMLAYSGRGHFQVQSVALNRILDEMRHLLETIISPKSVLRIKLADELPTAEADAGQIRQIILNLVTNADEALEEENGIISVSTGVMSSLKADSDHSLFLEEMKDGAYVYLEVSDTGCGIDEEVQSKIFDPFFTTKFTGRGLGLAAVLGIVRGHKGAIQVDSQPGRGSTIKVLLPAVAVEETQVLSETLAITPAKPDATILIVEDEEGVRTLTQYTLKQAGYTILTANDGKEGVEVFQKHHDDISMVLLDMTMPRMTGEEAFREMRLIHPGVRVLLTSGYNEQEATTRFAGKGLAGFIQKPYRPQELLTQIRAILQQKETFSDSHTD